MMVGLHSSGAARLAENDGFGEHAAHETKMFHDTLRMLSRHKVLFGSLFVAIAGIGLVVAFTLPPNYEASSIVLIEPARERAVSLTDVLSDAPADAESLASEMVVLTSRELLERVSEKANLIEEPEFNPALHARSSWPSIGSILSAIRQRGAASTPEQATPRRPLSDVVAALRKRLTIVPIGRSRAIQISLTSRSPRTAAAVVNAVAELYKADRLQLRDEATREANNWISNRIAELRARADKSAQAVERYRSEHGLTRGRDSLLVQQELTEASTQLTMARTRRSEAEATFAAAERALAAGHPEQIPNVLASPLVLRLREQEATANTRLADIAARTRDPNSLATTALHAELREVHNQITAEVNRIVEGLRQTPRIALANEATLSDRVAQLRTQVDHANTLDVGLQERQREAEADNALYQTFLTRSKETDPQLSFQSVNVRVVSRAVPPDHKSSPNRGLIAAAGIVLGAGIAFAAAFARDMMARGIRTRADVEKLVGTAPLGMLPHIRKLGDPLSQAKLDESVSSVWAQLMALPGAARPRSVVITSTTVEEGKTTMSRLLSVAAAELGQRVLVVDADMRCASFTQRFVEEGKPRGLADLLRGDAGLQDVIVRERSNLHVMPAGDCRGSPVSLLSSAALGAFVRQAEFDYDLVVFDSPPVLIGADAWLLACNVQATVMLARWGRTPKSAVAAALKQMTSVRARIAGVVLSFVDQDRHAQYDTEALPMSRKVNRYYKMALPQ